MFEENRHIIRFQNLIDKASARIESMAWHRAGEKSTDWAYDDPVQDAYMYTLRDLTELNHCPLDKMTDIFLNIFLKCSLCNENVGILILIALKCVPNDAFDNEKTLDQVMVWRRTGDKPLPEPMLTLFIGRIYGSLS